MFCFFFFNDTATTEIYTYDTLFPYTTLVRSIRAAIAAGIDTIEHVSLVDDEGIRMALARGRPVWFSMDIYNTEYTQAEGAKNGVLEDNLRKDREIAQIQRDNFRKAVKAGVRMVFGSDAGVMPHGDVGKIGRAHV